MRLLSRLAQDFVPRAEQLASKTVNSY